MAEKGQRAKLKIFFFVNLQIKNKQGPPSVLSFEIKYLVYSQTCLRNHMRKSGGTIQAVSSNWYF